MGGPPIPKQVLAAAWRHLDGTPPPRGMRWRLSWGQHVKDEWFLAYRIEFKHLPSRPESPFGFFTGCVVADDGTVCYGIIIRFSATAIQLGASYQWPINAEEDIVVTVDPQFSDLSRSVVLNLEMRRREDVYVSEKQVVDWPLPLHSLRFEFCGRLFFACLDEGKVE